MSIADFWKDLYEDGFKREESLREAKHRIQMQLIRCEGQRFSMLFSIELAADMLKASHPDFAQHLLNNIQQWKDRYEGSQLEQALGEIASLAPAVSGSAGSSSSPQAEAPMGMSQGSTEWEGMSFPKRQ